jgi:uncharacterized OsmC-like protein
MSKTKSSAAQAANTNVVNGLDLDALKVIVDGIEADPAQAKLGFRVSTKWQGQTRSEATIEGYNRAGEWIPRKFKIQADEPEELLGSNTAPNPQELLMAAVNACMMVGYAAGAALRGIVLTQLEIVSEGGIDTRGFLGHPDVPAGYTSLAMRVKIAGNGSAEDFQAIHDGVLKTSPNVFNLVNPVRIDATLDIAA